MFKVFGNGSKWFIFIGHYWKPSIELLPSRSSFLRPLCTSGAVGCDGNGNWFLQKKYAVNFFVCTSIMMMKHAHFWAKLLCATCILLPHLLKAHRMIVQNSTWWYGGYPHTWGPQRKSSIQFWTLKANLILFYNHHSGRSMVFFCIDGGFLRFVKYF